MACRRALATAALCAAGMLMAACAGTSPGAPQTTELTNLNVAVVPAADSAGFFVALYDKLFAAQGLRVRFVPAVSSETVINDQALSLPTAAPVDISCGNYVSYIQAQQAWDAGERPTITRSSMVAADLDIFAEGSIMQAGAQGLYVMPGSKVQSLSDLAGKTVGVNAPGNILYLLVASALADQGQPAGSVRYAYVPLPAMAAALKSGEVAAAVLPEPFASEAELGLGVRRLADLDQGATAAFPIQGCAVTRQWAAANTATLAAFRTAFEQGQEIADTNRAAVDQAMGELPAPLAVSRETAALMSLDFYPVGAVDAVRIQRVADVMREFLGFPRFEVASMVTAGA